MENTQEFISLYDYLGRAAGAELGTRVAAAAAKNKEKIHSKHVNTKKYTGIILTYRPAFLKSYFSSSEEKTPPHPPQAVLSLSGGMDSSTLLLHLLEKGYQVTAVGFNYGQKHKVELERATALVEYINYVENRVVEDGGKPGFFPVTFEIITLGGLSKLLNSSLVEGGAEVLEGHYEDINMKSTVVPNRNKIFSSIIQAVALSIANEKQQDVFISLGIHAGDHQIYPDCRQEFRDLDHEAFISGNWDADRVKFYTPYLDGNKFTILQDGERCCTALGLDFNEVYRRTMTSYKPIFIEHTGQRSLEEMRSGDFGEWYADYKSASSVERVEAFTKLGRPDPAYYADETGPVTWDTVCKHVKTVLMLIDK